MTLHIPRLVSSGKTILSLTKVEPLVTRSAPAMGAVNRALAVSISPPETTKGRAP